MLKLFGYWRSSATWRVRIALAHKGLEYAYHPVHLLRDGGEQHTEAYRAFNPMRQVPTLEIREGDRELHLTQSLAIIEYLEERFPQAPLLPKDPYLRAKARQLAEVVNSGIQPMQNLSVMQRIREELRGDDKAWVRYWVARGLTALEAQASETAGRFLVGDEVSIADLCLVPQLFNARRFEMDVERYPTLLAVETACAELPAFQAAHAERQPDAVP